MALQEQLLKEIRRLRRQGRIAVRALGFRVERATLYNHQEEFLYDTAGSTRRLPGYESVTTAAHDAYWYPPAIAARVRCLDALWAWLRPFQILRELNLDDDLDGWRYIDRAIAALDDVHRAAPAPDLKAFRAWERRRQKEHEIMVAQVVKREHERRARKYKTAA